MIRSLAPLGLLLLAACATPFEPDDGSADASASRDAASPVDAADDLVGFSETAVARAFGPPDRTRPEGDVAIWRYDGDDCVLELFFYPDDDEKRVRFAEARDRFGGSAEEAPCFERLSARTNVTS